MLSVCVPEALNGTVDSGPGPQVPFAKRVAYCQRRLMRQQEPKQHIEQHGSWPLVFEGLQPLGEACCDPSRMTGQPVLVSSSARRVETFSPVGCDSSQPVAIANVPRLSKLAIERSRFSRADSPVIVLEYEMRRPQEIDG